MSGGARAEPSLHLSVVVATYNRRPLLADALAALGAQRTPSALRWEIVVVDNNSSDGTHDLVQAMAARTRVSLRYVFEPRQGKSRALNTGIDRARGAVLALTDDDVLPAPDWVATAASMLARWDADGAGGRILPRWEGPPPRWLTASQRLLDRLALMEFDEPRALAFPVRGSPQVWGANMVFRRAVLLELGGFDTACGPVASKHYGGEDLEIVDRALAAGRRVVYDPALIVHHRIPRARMRRRYFRRWELEAAEGRVLREGVGGGARLLGGPRWLYRGAAAELVRWWSRALLRRADAFEHQLDFFAALGELRGSRKLRLGRCVPRRLASGPS